MFLGFRLKCMLCIRKIYMCNVYWYYVLIQCMYSNLISNFELFLDFTIEFELILPFRF